MATPIKLRLKEKLDQDDQGDIRVALLNYVIEEDADTSKLKPDHYMIRALLPYLNRVSTNWKGLIKEVNFVGSPIQCIFSVLLTSVYFSDHEATLGELI